MSLQFYNTLKRKKETFEPIDVNEIKMYSCGPTVYYDAHIGNLRAYVFTDLLCRVIRYEGLKLKQIMNITDVGHLSSDADSGEDKMTKGLLREGKELTLKNMRELAEFYAKKFQADIQKLNIRPADGMYFASDFIQEDIDLIKKLEEKGYTYQISDGVYFDISKMSDYGVLRGGVLTNDDSRSRLAENSEKKNRNDFVLWKLDNKIGFDSPFGKGFPGWHIECSAMSMKFLGEQFDIHTGGVDHISIHHTNEIAQSECATGKKPYVRFWMHNEHVDMGGIKMAKSEDNFLTLDSIIEKGINPLAYRFWLLTASYRTKVNFTWEALEGAETALKRLYRAFLDLGDEAGDVSQEYRQKFQVFIEDDLDTPQALALVWDLLKDDNVSNADKKATLLDFDKVLGLGLEDLKEEIIPEEIMKLVEEREQARKNKDFKKSDEIREKIKSLGYEIKDSGDNYKINKI